MATNEVAREEANRRNLIRPRYGIAEEKGVVSVILEMPGIKKDAISMTVENNELRILAKRPDTKQQGRFITRERTPGDYYQTFTLDETIDRDNIEATLDKGILTLSLHLKEEVKPKTIKVKTA